MRPIVGIAAARPPRSAVLLHLLLLTASASPLAVTGESEDFFPPIPGWKVQAESTVYLPATLWEFINGAADLYLSYGFADLHVAYYTDSRGNEVRAEAYRHESPADAFGIYAQERPPESQAAPFGCEGYRESSMLNFVAGPLYIKLSSNQEGPEIDNALAAVARAVEGTHALPKEYPEGLGWLPKHGRVARSEQYAAHDHLGYTFFRKVFSARYGDAGECHVFVFQEPRAEDVGRVLDAYEAVAGPGGRGENEAVHEFRDPNNGPVTLVVRATKVLGIVDCRNEEIRKTIMEEFLRTP